MRLYFISWVNTLQSYILDSAECHKEEIYRKMILVPQEYAQTLQSSYRTEIETRRKRDTSETEIANRRNQDHSYARNVTIDHPSLTAASRSPEPDYAILYLFRYHTTVLYVILN